MSIRVVRVGGSLLTWNLFVPTFQAWLSGLSPARNVLIAGGGPWVELLRQASRRFDINAADAHMLCIQAMSLTASLLHELFHYPLVRNFDEMRGATLNSHCTIFDVHSYLVNVDSLSAKPLPHSWRVTSDSIAARIACHLNAEELVLVKSGSCPIENETDREQLSKMGFVDDYFPTASRELANVTYIDLREVNLNGADRPSSSSRGCGQSER